MKTISQIITVCSIFCLVGFSHIWGALHTITIITAIIGFLSVLATALIHEEDIIRSSEQLEDILDILPITDRNDYLESHDLPGTVVKIPTSKKSIVQPEEVIKPEFEPKKAF